MAKAPITFEWVEDLLPKNHLRKPMFGGFAYYFGPLLIMVVFESEGDRTYKKIQYDFDLWNGCMFPSERENHEAILKKFPFLFSHPVLGTWLYLPAQSEDFESHAETILKEIRRHSPLFGTIPKAKKKASRQPTKPEKKSSSGKKLSLTRPTMFSDEPGDQND